MGELRYIFPGSSGCCDLVVSFSLVELCHASNQKLNLTSRMSLCDPKEARCVLDPRYELAWEFSLMLSDDFFPPPCDQVILEREYIFRNSKKKYVGVPVIAANMDTTGTFEMALALSKVRD